jgi:hypothetical protein
MKKENQEISDNHILRYVEGKMSKQENAEFSEFLQLNKKLQIRVNILQQLVDDEPTQSPPKYLTDSVIEKLNLSTPSLMEIILKKTNNVFEVIKGIELLQPSPKTLMAIRGDSEYLHVFKTKADNYHILCHMIENKDGQTVQFSLEDEDGKHVKNGRFQLWSDDTKVMEVLTDSTGSTFNQAIEMGKYSIDISLGQKNLGTIQLCIS